jgi:phospholipid/cholesterol/gamma-HCH transport system substrate-binding protein
MSGRRLAVLLALAGATVLAALLVKGGDRDYLVRAVLANAGGLREGFTVRVDGVPVGKVTHVELGAGDRAIVEAHIEDGAAPLGAGARATVRAVNLLGEKYLDLDRGDMRHPDPSPATIPAARTGVAVELDDVLDTLDLPTRAALNVVLDEAGRGLGGRGRDLASLLSALPSALDRTGELVRQVGSDTRALGRLVDESDRVVGAVAAQRPALGRLVSAGAQTLDTLAGRRRELADTVRGAPGTLSALRSALAALQGAAIPLAPAARGLRATAQPLTATLRQLPPTTRVARPALQAALRVAPSLDRLGREGTPLAARLRPLARELRTFSTGIDPATKGLDGGIADFLGFIEGWARTTAGRDEAGHVFRLDTTLGSDLLAALAAAGPQTATRRDARDRMKPAPALGAPAQPGLPAPAPSLPQLPALRLPRLPAVTPKAPQAQDVKPLLDYLLAP